MTSTTTVDASTRHRAGVGPREFIVMISTIMALMAVGIDLMLPGFDDMREAFDLGEGSNRVGQVITFYFYGLAGAQVVWGPLADRFGRKPVLTASIVLYIAGAAASALAPTFGMLLGARVFWGMGAAGARVVATAMVRDLFVGDRMAKAMSQVMAVFVVVPVFAPSLGGLLVAVFPWRAMFWFCVIWAAIVWLWTSRLGETLDPADVRAFSLSEARASYSEVARTWLTVGNTIAVVFLQAVFTLYLATSEHIISDLYGYESTFTIIFGVVAVGFGLMAMLNSRYVERFGIQTMVQAGLAIAVGVSVALLGFTLLGDGLPSFWIFMPLTGIVLCSFMLMMPNLNTEAMMPVGHIAGSASAFTSAIRIGVGSLLAEIWIRQVDETVTPFVVSMVLMAALTAVTVAVVQRDGRAAVSPN